MSDLCPPCQVIEYVACCVRWTLTSSCTLTAAPTPLTGVIWSTPLLLVMRNTLQSPVGLGHTQCRPFMTHFLLTDYPSSCYHSDKSSLSSRKTASTVAITTNAAGRRSEIARQFSHLLSSSSPLVGENLKVTPP